MRHLLVLTMSLLVVGMGTLWAAVPSLMNYQGRATSSGAAPLTGSFTITFSIYAAPSGGNPLWTESHTGVTITDGLFTLMLGSVTPFPTNLFDDSVRYLGVTIGADPEMTPRTRFTSAAYAFRAGFADSTSGTAAWTTTGSDVYRATGNVGIGTASPSEKLQIEGNLLIDAYNAGERSGIFFREGFGSDAINDSGKQNLSILVRGLGSPMTPDGLEYNAHDGHIFTTDFGTERMVIREGGNVGIGTSAPTQRLQIESGNLQFSGGDIPNAFMGGVRFGTSYSGWDLWSGIEGWTAGGLDQAYLSFFTSYGNRGERMRITPTGDVGIGTTNPIAKLHVIGDLCVTGAKNAIVRTSQGMTKMYSEESAEVWFTDYGKARLENGECRIDLDPLFLETVTIDDENQMMVFLQEEDECNGLYVKIGDTTFDVIEKDAGQSNASFSYRVVAKRKGLENKRLESAQTASAGGGK